MKFIYIVILCPLFFFCQKKDTIENSSLSLYYNVNNKLYRVVNRQTGKEFTGWGKFTSSDRNIYRYYENNKLVYIDYRDLENKIIKREVICNDYSKCLELHDYYDYNINVPKTKYFICQSTNNDGNIVEKKCRGYFEYYKDGQIKVKGQYENDKEKGIWTYFDEKGKVIKQINKSKL